MVGLTINNDYCPICQKNLISFISSNNKVIPSVIRKHFARKDDAHKMIYNLVQSLYDKHWFGQISDLQVRHQAITLGLDSNASLYEPLRKGEKLTPDRMFNF